MHRRVNITLALLLFLLTSSFPQSAHAHAFWAEDEIANNRVLVEFSEHAGVPDKVVDRFASRVPKMLYTGVDNTTEIVSMHLNSHQNVLEGNLPPQRNDSPYLISGFVDNGPYERFHDVRFSFGAQMYSKNADYEQFFRPLLKTVTTPTIVMRNCGGSKNGTMSYQFDIGGFPSEGPLGVCIYRAGGMQLGCGNFDSNQEIEEEEGLQQKDSRQRKLRGDAAGAPFRPKMDFSMEVNIPMSEQLLFAKANKTVTEEGSGDITILFATTSVYFQGPCKE